MKDQSKSIFIYTKLKNPCLNVTADQTATIPVYPHVTSLVRKSLMLPEIGKIGPCRR